MLDPAGGSLTARDVCMPVDPADRVDVDAAGEELGGWYAGWRRLLPFFFSKEGGTGGIVLLHEVISELLGLKEEETRRRERVEKTDKEVAEQIPLGLAVCDGQETLFSPTAWPGT